MRDPLLDLPNVRPGADEFGYPTRRRGTKKQCQRRGMFILGATMSVLAGGGMLAVNAVNNSRAAQSVNEAQPACDLRPKVGMGVMSLRRMLQQIGDTNPGEAQIVTEEGRVRNYDDDPVRYGELLILPDDIVRFTHVRPEVCEIATTQPELYLSPDRGI